MIIRTTLIFKRKKVFKNNINCVNATINILSIFFSVLIFFLNELRVDINMNFAHYKKTYKKHILL